MAGKIRAVVVDDEAPARALLREYLAGCADVELVAECCDGFEAVKVVEELRPDLLLLDIQMPKLDGFEVLELVGSDAAVVFVTAYDEYALRAFEVHAVDYLLKPFAPERLAQAIERAHERLASGRPTAMREVAAAARAHLGPVEHVLVREGARVHVIPVDTLDLVRAQDDYVLFRAEGKEYRKQQTLLEIEARLDPERFVRVHRSFVINLSRLARIDLYAKNSRVAVLADGTRVPLSRAGYARLKILL